MSATCRGCGCTDERACDPPCWWAEPDLCSACATKLEAMQGQLDALVREGFLERRVNSLGNVLYRISDVGAHEMERQIQRERDQDIVDQYTDDLEAVNDALIEGLLR